MRTKVNLVPSKKIINLPTYIFAELDVWKEEARAKGVDIIDLGIGNPDGPTPAPIVEAAIESIKKPESHGYPSFRGKKELREAIAAWMKSRYNVNIDPETEVQTLIGAKEGIAHIAFAYTDPGDINIVPDPYYPVFSRGTWVSSGEVYHIPLKEENDFLPDLKSIPDDIAEKAKIFLVNFPNNPTAAVATKEFYTELVEFCTKNNILLVTDLAYGEICYDGFRPLSIFEIPGSKDIAIEFHSFSKTFNMAGWRVGFAVGNKDVIANLYKMKTNIDYGTSSIVQDAATCALNIDYSYIQKTIDKYQNRRDFVIEGFKKLGWNHKKTKATMYLWFKVPSGNDSKSWCKMVFDKTGVVFTPGIAFGNYSDNYFRVSLVQPDERLKKALLRLEEANIRYE
ncbi:MAG: LL-diaminopimelate aminotransferase [Candidatus Gastranaerophilaceae bacterium]